MPALALISYWKPLALAALIATALVYRAVLIHQRDTARANAASLLQKNAALMADNTAMRAAVSNQNAAIENLRTAMSNAQAAAQARAAGAQARGARALQSSLARANQLKTAALPAGCDAAIRWGNAQGPELGRW